MSNFDSFCSNFTRKKHHHPTIRRDFITLSRWRTNWFITRAGSSEYSSDSYSFKDMVFEEIIFLGPMSMISWSIKEILGSIILSRILIWIQMVPISTLYRWNLPVKFLLKKTLSFYGRPSQWIQSLLSWMGLTMR